MIKLDFVIYSITGISLILYISWFAMLYWIVLNCPKFSC